ncbi:MAG: magnesium transporter MgtE [Nitrospirae bacterium GWC2_57_13]|nr:MAG: magnesium transporter MgtE [Nitrospirae bacterium GWC2_57_13]
MPFFAGDIFISEVLNKPVLDQTGDEIGRLKDIVVGPGEPFPSVLTLLAVSGRETYVLPWDRINIFNRRVISVAAYLKDLKPAAAQATDILLSRDFLDKQIVDINGAKLVRVNDLKLGEVKGKLCLVAADMGLRGILRRLGLEARGEKFLSLFRYKLPHKLVGWNFVQTVEPKLTRLTLTVSRQKVSKLHPADLAEIMSEISQKERRALFSSLDVDTASEALHELEPRVQYEIINEMTTIKASELLESMPPDEAADILGNLPEERAQQLIKLMEKEEAEDVQELMEHEEDTAGGLMTNEFLAFPPDMTVEEAIKELRLAAPDVETIYYLYVIDESEQLKGVLSLKNLILARPEKRLEEIMKAPAKTVALDAEEKDVAEFISKYNYLAAPVVDENNVMHGIVTVDDVLAYLLPTASQKKRRRL